MRHALSVYPRERDPVSIVQEIGWTSRKVSTDERTSPPTGFDSGKVQQVASLYTYLLTQPFKPRIKFHLLFAGIIRSSPFSPRKQNKG